MIGEVLGKVFGTKKAVDDVLDKDNGHLAKAGAWIGNLSHTEEEKAEDRREMRKTVIDFVKASSEPFKIAQRYLALVIMAVWALIAVNLLLAIWIWALTKEATMFNGQQIWIGVNAMEPLLRLVQEQFIWAPISGVLMIYFLGGTRFGKK